MSEGRAPSAELWVKSPPLVGRSEQQTSGACLSSGGISSGWEVRAKYPNSPLSSTFLLGNSFAIGIATVGTRTFLLEAIPSCCALFSPGDPWCSYLPQSPTQQGRKLTTTYISNSRGLAKQIHLLYHFGPSKIMLGRGHC